MATIYGFNSRNDVQRVADSVRITERNPKAPRTNKRRAYPVILPPRPLLRYQCVQGMRASSANSTVFSGDDCGFFGGGGQATGECGPNATAGGSLNVYAVEIDEEASAYGIGKFTSAEMTQLQGGDEVDGYKIGVTTGAKPVYLIDTTFYSGFLATGDLFVGDKTYAYYGPGQHTINATLSSSLTVGDSAAAEYTRRVDTNDSTQNIVEQITVRDTANIATAEIASGTIVLCGFDLQASRLNLIPIFGFLNAVCPAT